jgi:hypothetical protein
MNVNPDGSLQPIVKKVQVASATSTGSVATLAKAFASNNTYGNSIVVVAHCGNGTAMTCADSAGNVYQSAIAAPNSTTFASQIFYSVGVAGGGGIAAGANTVTVTNAGTAASMAITIYEVSGVITQVPGAVGQTSKGTGTGTTATTSIIAGHPNALAFMGVSIGTAVQNITVTSGTNWTADGGTNGLVPTTPSGLYQAQSLTQSISGLGTVLPTATLAGSEPWAAASAVFRPVASFFEGTVRIAGYNPTNITTSTTTLVKTGPGVLHAIVVNTAPASGGTLEIDDAVTNTNSKGIVTSPAVGTLVYDMMFTTGLSITTATHAGDYTILWA